MKTEINYPDLKRNYEKKVIKKFLDVKDIYKSIEGIKNNPVIYTVYINDFVNFEWGLTVIEPGTINKEFYMTKGHKHEKKRKEIYIPIIGKGKLFIKDKKEKIFELKKNKVYIVPAESAHRLINTGNDKLEVLTLYSKDSGHNYKVKFKKRFFKK